MMFLIMVCIVGLALGYMMMSMAQEYTEHLTKNSIRRDYGLPTIRFKEEPRRD